MPATWTGLSGSARGDLHKELGKKNQDSVRVSASADSLFLAVADGHGSGRSFRSDRGADLATECALRVLRDFTWKNGLDTPWHSIRRQAERRLPYALVNEWHKAVGAELAQNPFSPLDFAAFPEKAPALGPGAELTFSAYLAYGATLLVAALTPHYLIYAQIGDGDILLVHADGSVSRPWPREHAFFSTETISLCSYDAAQECKVLVQRRRAGAPVMVLLATDGYSNCFPDDEAFFSVGTDLLSYVRTQGRGFVQEHIEEWLSESSRDGSRDDITLAMAVRLSTMGSSSSLSLA